MGEILVDSILHIKTNKSKAKMRKKTLIHTCNHYLEIPDYLIWILWG